MVNSNAEGRELRTGDGRRIILAALIKSGGAGSVYRVREQTDVVAKLYHDSVDLPLYERKVTAMLQLTPELPDLFEAGKRYVQIAWPRALLRDLHGRFVGYLMPAVDVKATSELECVLQEKQARKLGLPSGLGAKITLAANLAGVLAELHRQQHRIVDLKPVNLRFYPSSLYMAVLDCDGFSIQGRGERFEAPQYTVEYLAPEFQRGGLSALGEEAQDRFALAVVVFQLLNFGIHPFTGRPTSEGVPTDIPGRIAMRLYAYGQRGNPRLLPSPVSGHEAMPAELRSLFDRAFEGAGTARPSALEWGSALRGYAQRSSLRLTNCTRVREHQHFAGLACAACARVALLDRTAKSAPPSPPSRIARAPRAAAGAPRATRAPGRGGFHWSRPGSAAARAKAAPTPAVPNWPPHTPLPGGRGAPLWPVNPSPPRTFRPPSYARSSGKPSGCFIAIVATIVFMVAFLIVLGLIIGNGRDPPGPDIRPYGPKRTIPEAPPEPPPIAPIASSEFALPGIAEPSAKAIEGTRVSALWLAVATADDNRVLIENTTRRLRSYRRNQLSASQPRRQELQDRFFEFAAAAPGMETAQRLDFMRELDTQLGTEPYNAEYACEWSWLALLEGRRDYAYDGFLRAIWADPQYFCGWLGLGALTEDASASYGALVMANTLELAVGVPDMNTVVARMHARDALVERALATDALALARWQVLDARASIRVATQQRQPLADPLMRERAGRTLPQPAR